MLVREARIVPPLALLLVALVSGCVPGDAAAAPQPSSPPTRAVEVRELSAPTLLLPSEDPAELALTASQLVFEHAPVVVLASPSDAVAASALAPVATAVHGPALLADGPRDRALLAEVDRLGARAAVVVQEDQAAVDGGDAGSWASPEPSDAEAAARAAGLRVVVVDASDVVSAGTGAEPGTDPSPGADTEPGLDAGTADDLRDQLGADLPREAPTLLTEVLALVDPAPGQEAALATLRAAGAVTVADPGGDPGSDSATIGLVAEAHALTVLGVGPAYAATDDATFAWQVTTAETGLLLPHGSQRVDGAAFDGVRTRVGQDLPDPADAEPGTVPTVVLRAAARQWSAGDDGDYVRAEPLDQLTASVDAARKAGQYVVLELEGGRVALVDQVRALEPLLAQGGVGVMVHPEQRRSGAGQERSGNVTVAELQAVVDELSGLAVEKSLPQLLLAVRSLDTAVEDDGGAALVPSPQVAVVDSSALGLAR